MVRRGINRNCTHAALVLLGAILLWSPTDPAQGSGHEIRVLSTLSAPLYAAIPIRVKIASPATFRQYGLPYPQALNGARVSLVPTADNGGLRIVLSTSGPVHEPLLTFLLVVNWPDMRTIHQYTVLLDPTTTADQRPTKRQPKVESVAQSLVPSQKVATNRSVPATRHPETAPTTARKTYGPIHREDALWVIAKKLRYAPDITINQMMVALFNANPQAFKGNNINGLRKWATLSVPTEAAVRGIAPHQAYLFVAAQNKHYHKF